MRRILTYALIVTMLFAGAAFVACGGGDDEDEDRPPAAEEKDQEEDEAAQEEEADEDEDADEEGDEDSQADEEDADADEEEEEDAGDAEGTLDGVPVYPGAKETMTGEWSGSEAPVAPVAGAANPEDYESVKYGMYETDDSVEKVFEWYKDKMKGWKEEWSFGGSGEDGASGMGVWTKDGGKQAAWVMVNEEDGKTSLMLIVGTQ